MKNSHDNMNRARTEREAESVNGGQHQGVNAHSHAVYLNWYRNCEWTFGITDFANESFVFFIIIRRTYITYTREWRANAFAYRFTS